MAKKAPAKKAAKKAAKPAAKKAPAKKGSGKEGSGKEGRGQEGLIQKSREEDRQEGPALNTAEACPWGVNVEIRAGYGPTGLPDFKSSFFAYCLAAPFKKL